MTTRDRIAQATSPGLTTTLIVLSTIAALTFLVYQAKVNGDAAIALFSAIIGGIISTAGSKAAQPPNGS